MENKKKFRQFKITEIVTFKSGRKVLRTRVRDGIQIVHIGEDVWRIGRTNFVINKATCKEENHCVIYGPNNKEYNIFGKDVEMIKSYASATKSRPHYNLGMLKVLILTQILDNISNWCFDLSKIPDNGKLKVIYDNGTVKNIDFNGTFLPFISNKARKKYGKQVVGYDWCKNNPVAYRKND